MILQELVLPIFNALFRCFRGFASKMYTFCTKCSAGIVTNDKNVNFCPKIVAF